MRRRAGLRTWTRALGASGLTPEAEAWVEQVEHEVRSAVLGDPGYLEDSGESGRSQRGALATLASRECRPQPGT